MIVPDCMKIWRVLAALKMKFNRILMFWKVQGFYDREKINELIDEFEQFYDSFFKQE